jgi:dolichol-phosphate mannosyltransferase
MTGLQFFMKVSVVIPAYNEEAGVIPLCEGIKKAMEGMEYEVMFVDDGSTDNTRSEFVKAGDRRFRLISLGKHMGKCFALYRGMMESSGGIIATLDSDLQNDPGDIPAMVKELEKGWDCVCGWRFDRKDSLSKRVSSRIGNFVNNRLLGLEFHDNNCPVKVFRRECVSEIRYFKNFHRFMPAMIRLQGFRIGEFRVRHYPRMHGSSKYGIRNRVFGNLMTMLMVKFRHKELLEWS